MQLTRKTVFLLGWITLLGFGLAGALIIHLVHNQSVTEVLDKGMNTFIQIVIGIVYGLIASWIAIQIIEQKFFTAVRIFFLSLFDKLNLKIRDVIFLSICAGIGEELLFRAGIQPLLGIWLTAILFIVLHGYINYKNWQLSVYGASMIIVSAGLGYLYEFVGLIASIIAHITIDVVLFTQFLIRKNEA